MLKSKIKELKGFVAGIIFTIILSGTIVTANPTTQEMFFGVFVNLDGTFVSFEDDSRPFIMDGRTFLPVRAIADLFGADVDFDESTNTVLLYSGGVTVGRRNHAEREDKFVSVVIDGARCVDIHDSYGNRIFQVGNDLYKRTRSGVFENVGVVWLINYRTHRFQYVLDPGEYFFSNMVFLDEIMPEIMVLYFDNSERNEIAQYLDFQPCGQTVLIASPTDAELITGNTQR